MDAQHQLVIDTIPLAAAIAATIAKRVPRHIDPQDLFQDACVGLLHARNRYDPERGIGFRTYARGRINGAVLDGLRREDHLSRRDRSMLRAEGTELFTQQVQLDGADDLPGESLMPGDWAMDAELNALVAAAMENLPVVMRDVLRGYYFEEKVQSEIAAQLGIGTSFVSRLHLRALGLLREYFEDQGFTSATEVCR